MMKNRFISAIFTLIVCITFFVPKVLGATDGNYTLQIDFDPTGYGYFTTMYISDFATYPTATYHVFMKDDAGNWTTEELELVVDPSFPNTWHSLFTPPEGSAAEIYMYRRVSADEPMEFLTGVNYNGLTRTNGARIDIDPTASIPAVVLPPFDPGSPDPEPPAPGPSEPSPSLPPVDYDNKITNFTVLATRAVIALAVFSSVFLLPYMGVLWASGNPENIKKANEWFFSWFTGILFLLMSGIIIRIIGTDFLSLGT